MARMNWGGAQDLSGVFASLQRQYENDVEADVANARARAAEEQAAEDREMHAKWMAGKISDEEWLAHLERRVDESLDAEERSQYTEMLLEHRGAIQDAQMEARFAMGQVSLGQLMKHYSGRMAGVDKNSPAWRELAMRYGQLSGGVGGGGGGGGGRRGGGRGGGGSGRGSADAATVVGASLDVLQSGEVFKGIHTGGPDLIDPTLSLRPIENDDDLINALLSDIERIEQLEDWMSEHPGDRTVVDEATGEEFEVSGDFLIQLDKQYLRTQQALAAAYYARGTSEDDKKGTQALGYATAWVAGAMTRHNTVRAEPQVRMLEQFAFSEIIGASNISDPEERRRAYASALSHVATYAHRQELVDSEPAPRSDLDENPAKREAQLNRMTESPDALRPDADIYTRVQVLMGVLRIGAQSDRFTIDELNAMADEVLALSGTVGEGELGIDVATLLNGLGEDGSASGVPDNFIGLLETMTQVHGLEAGRRILAGTPDPEYDGPVYVYAFDGERTMPVIADVRDQPNAAGGVSPVLVPQGEDPNGLVMARVKIGSKVQTVWVRPQPVDDPRYRIYIRDNELLTSAEIQEMGMARLQALIGQGSVQVDSVLTGVRLPDGRVWFRDEDTGMYHLTPPVSVDRDATTGGVLVGEDGEAVINPLPFSQGVMTPFAGVTTADMQRWTEEAVAMGLLNPLAFRQRGAGGDIVDLESVIGMYQPVQEPKPRSAPLLIEDQIEARRQVSEEDFMRAGGDAVTAIRNQEFNRPSVAESTMETANRMGIVLGGPREVAQVRGMAPPRVSGQEQERSVWPAGERYLRAMEGAMAAIAARAGKKSIWELNPGYRAPAPTPAPIRAPLPLLPKDQQALAPKKPATPMPQYNPSTSSGSGNGYGSGKPVSTGKGKSGGAKLI